jgi:hypothetical protein
VARPPRARVAEAAASRTATESPNGPTPDDSENPELLAAEADPPTGSEFGGRSTADRPASGRKRGPVPKLDQLGQIREELAKDLTRLGIILSIPRPLMGLVLVNRAERAADALVLLAQQNPRVLRLLKMVAGASVYAELGAIVGELVIAGGVEAGAVPVGSPLTSSIRQEIEIVLAVEAQRAAEAERRAAAQTEGEAGTPPSI